MTDSSIDRVYKYIDNNVLGNIKNVDNIDDYIIENIYKNLIISCSIIFQEILLEIDYKKLSYIKNN